VEVQLHAFLTSALGEGEWSASHPCHFNPREGVPGANWIGGWMAPRAIKQLLCGTMAVNNRKDV